MSEDFKAQFDAATPECRRLVADAVSAALLAGIETAAKIRDANQTERRRLEAEIERLREVQP